MSARTESGADGGARQEKALGTARPQGPAAPVFLLVAVLLLATFFRAVVLPARWVGPDEGSYLMDARLVMQGKVPIVDFAARQPLFLWLLAGLFEVFGPSLLVARLFLIGCSVAAGAVLYRLGKQIFCQNVALVGVTVALLLPFQAVWSVSVMTEMPALLLECICACATILALHKSSRWYGLAAGLAAGAAYFTRETAVAAMAVAVLYVLVVWRGPWRTKSRVATGLLVGCLLACGAVWAYYARYLALHELFFSRLNPLDLVLSQLVQGQYSLTPTTSAAIGAVQAAGDIETYAHELFAFGLFGLVGALGAAMFAARKRQDEGRPRGIGLLFLWVGLVVGMHLIRFLFVEKVLFSRYLLEVLPPLSLLFGFTLVRVLQWQRNTLALVVLVAGLTIGVYSIQHAAWQHFPGAGSYFVGATALAALLLGGGDRAKWLPAVMSVCFAAGAVALASQFRVQVPFGMQSLVRCSLAIAIWYALFRLASRTTRPDKRRHCVNLATLTLVMFAFVYSLGKQGQKIGPSYEGVWSPATLRLVTRELQTQARPGDVVLSGGQIWTFAAGLECFLDITHTLGLLYLPDSAMEKAFSERPPEFIILDGYTEKRTLPHAPLLAGKLTALYEKVAVVPGSPHPVSIFRRRPELVTAPQDH